MADDFLFDAILGDGDPLESAEIPAARAHRATARRRLQRIAQQEALADVIQAPPAPGETIHVLSDSKFDFWTWVPVMVDWLGTVDALYCSTWTLSRTTAVELAELWDAGKIAAGQVCFLTGLHFKRRETAVYATLLDTIRTRGGQYRAFRNHAKLLLLHNEAAGHYLTVEGSANLTANPRAEQYAITHDRELWAFYREWFHEMAERIAPEPEG